jgi:hypothetical protein
VSKDKVIRVTIGKYGMPTNAQIKDETEDAYLLAFHDTECGYEVFRHWYTKDKVTLHNQGEHQ